MPYAAMPLRYMPRCQRRYACHYFRLPPLFAMLFADGCCAATRGCHAAAAPPCQPLLDTRHSRFAATLMRHDYADMPRDADTLRAATPPRRIYYAALLP